MTREQWAKRRNKTSKGYMCQDDVWKWEDVERIEGPYIKYENSHCMTLILHFKSEKKIFVEELDTVYEEVPGLFFGKREKLITGSEYFDNEEYHNEKFKNAEDNFKRLKNAYVEYIRSL